MSGEAGKVAVPGGTLRYEVAGSGPEIVLLHGFSFDMRCWDPQFEAMAATHRVVRYDLRGFGASSLPDGEYDHCADLAALLDHLGIERPMLLGLSLGANIALRFSILHPRRVAALILASPGLPGHVWKEERPPDAAREHAKRHGVEAARKFWVEHPFLASLDDYPEARALVRDMVADYSGFHWRGADPQAPAEPFHDRLHEVQAPTLVLSGERDAGGYREIAGVIAQRIPEARLVTFADCGHMLNLENPAAFNRAVRDFAESRAITTA